MDFLNDPDLREVVVDFCKESNIIFDELEEILEGLEDRIDPKEFERFGQAIDRVMGAAKNINLDQVGVFCELGKIIGYKASQVKDEKLLSVVVAVMFDAVDLLKKMIHQVERESKCDLKTYNTEAFVTRLKWLSDKFKNIERASCGYQEEETLDQGNIDNLLDQLGL